MGYDAFISYSHAADGRLAPALQSGMQRFAKRWNRRRALHVFRDETGLSTNPHLWSSIESALDSSEWFVLLASPEAASSEWVNREIAHWLTNKSADRILPVVTDGAWSWDAASGTLAGDAVPDALRAALREEPRHLDLRWARTETDLDLRNSRFRAAVADLAAPIHGVAKDDLEGEDIRQHRRARRLARGAFMVVTVLLVVALMSTGFALSQRNRADHNAEVAGAQRRVAERQAVVADAGRLAALAVDRAPAELDLGLLLAVEGHRLHDSVDTRRGLLSVLAQSPHLSALRRLVGANATAADLSPDDKSIVAGDRNGTLRISRIADSGPSVAPIHAHDGEIIDVAYSHDGRTIATVGNDGSQPSTRLFDAKTGNAIGEPLRTPGAFDFWLAFSPNDQVLATVGTGGAQLWDLPARKPRPQRTDGGIANAVVFSPDGTKLVVAETAAVAMVGLASGGTDRFAAGLPASAVTFSPDSTTLAVGGSDGTVQVFDATSRQLRWHVVGHEGRVTTIAFASDGRTLATGAVDGKVIRWNAATGARVGAPLTGVNGNVLTVAFTDGARGLLAAGAGDVASWALDTNLLGERVSAARGDLESIALAGRVLATAGDHLRLWDTTTRRPRATLSKLEESPFARVAISPDGSRLATAGGGSPPGVAIWDIATGRKIPGAVVGDTFSVAFSPDGRTLAVTTGLERKVVLIDATRATPTGIIMNLGSGLGVVFALAFSPDGHSLVTGDNFGELRFWDPTTGKQRDGGGRRPREVDDLAFSEDGRLLASAGGDGNVEFWDPQTRQPLGAPLIVGTGPLARIALSPDGRTMAVVSQDGLLTLWDLATRQAISRPITTRDDATPATETRPDAELPDVVYQDASMLITSSIDGSLTFWDLRSESWERTACQLAGRNLTHSEWKQLVGNDVPYHRTCSQWPPGT